MGLADIPQNPTPVVPPARVIYLPEVPYPVEDWTRKKAKQLIREAKLARGKRWRSYVMARLRNG